MAKGEKNISTELIDKGHECQFNKAGADQMEGCGKGTVKSCPLAFFFSFEESKE